MAMSQRVAAEVALAWQMRRTDVLPVGEEQPDEVLERGFDSEFSDEDDGCGLEYASDSDDEGFSETGDPDVSSGSCLRVFLGDGRRVSAWNSAPALRLRFSRSSLSLHISLKMSFA